MRHLAPAITTSFLAILAGCGTQAPPDYQGEPLATVHGILTSHLDQPLPESELVMAWADWSKGEGDGEAAFTNVSTFVRLPVAATLPARFSTVLLDPPPTTAYPPRPDAPPRLLGPRFTDATILLVRKGAAVTSTVTKPLDLALRDPQQAVLAVFHPYYLEYVESSGPVRFEQEDGTILMGPELTKGYHLYREDSVSCATSFDEACIARAMANGTPAEWAWEGCATIEQEGIPVEIPLDTEITLDLNDTSDVHPARPPLCAPASP